MHDETIIVVFHEYVEGAGGGGDYPHYEGPYRVIPRVYEQRLDTADKIMDNDVDIREIPLAEVDNPQGGRTCTIG